MPSSSSYRIFLYWLLLAGLIVSAVFVSWDLGVLEKILVEDITRISVIVLLLLFLASMHCGYRSWYLTRQLLMHEHLRTNFSGLTDENYPPFPKGVSVIQDYLTGLSNGDSEQDKTLLSEVMAESLRGSHQVGWFISGLVIKLGLLGTVIGFVLMLGSISGLENLDISDIKQLMTQMTQGMGVAMNTTMVGLVSSMLLGLQYLLLDRCADGVVAEGVSLGQEFCNQNQDDNE
ncbi:MotA/TolQ/ExbB proton channel family protein [Neptuniibacter sp.]|uniref:MotA/TolQ/ExbB proton channel family protein n=1 Tax=Neptuniibacter sp. TaxID=1962643 RepID=UPI0026071F96|nr:MotA/TolQ/ExbB proton channel family protein [Neptuniibacter sp.]MCP4595446.1 MotA/TolQ/ExbB proton channel family protein [Neptuniibacter sp.]